MYVRYFDVFDIIVLRGLDNLKGYYKLLRYYRWVLLWVFDVFY